MRWAGQASTTRSSGRLPLSSGRTARPATGAEAAAGDPALADGGQALAQVDAGVGLRVGSGRIVDPHRGLLRDRSGRSRGTARAGGGGTSARRRPCASPGSGPVVTVSGGAPLTGARVPRCGGGLGRCTVMESPPQGTPGSGSEASARAVTCSPIKSGRLRRPVWETRARWVWRSRTRATRQIRPFAGMTRIRFKGIGSPPSQPRSWDAPRTAVDCARDGRGVKRVLPAKRGADGGRSSRAPPGSPVPRG